MKLLSSFLFLVEVRWKFLKCSVRCLHSIPKSSQSSFKRTPLVRAYHLSLCQVYPWSREFVCFPFFLYKVAFTYATFGDSFPSDTGCGVGRSPPAPGCSWKWALSSFQRFNCWSSWKKKRRQKVANIGNFWRFRVFGPEPRCPEASFRRCLVLVQAHEDRFMLATWPEL